MDADDPTAVGANTFYLDADGDGFGLSSTTTLSCDAPTGYATVSGDCDDTDASVHPGAAEYCDGIDDDCNGTLDDATAEDATTWYRDADADSFGNASAPKDACTLPTGYVANAADCDDTDASVFPGAAEAVGDENDQDCDDTEVCYLDDDDDGARSTGALSSGDVDCDDPREAPATAATDCDDTNARTFPGAPEVPSDGVDQDCDGGDTCYLDADLDGFLPATASTIGSSDLDCADAGEATASTPGGDCDPSNAFVYPGAAEVVGDEVDQDCDGGDVCFQDADGDHARSEVAIASVDLDCRDAGEASLAAPEDCDDDDATVQPGATERVGDEVDQDCDGRELCYDDQDDDGFLASLDLVVSSADIDCGGAGEGRASDPGGDCDPTDPAVWPGAPEIVGDGADQDCDGLDACWVDQDGDGWRTDGTVASTDGDCNDDGEADPSAGEGDCDDADSSVNPGASEVVGDLADQDCDGGEACLADADQDGWRGTDTVLSADLDCDDPGEALPEDTDGDCNDADASVYPGAEEVTDDGIDQDCDGGDRAGGCGCAGNGSRSA